MTETPKKDDYSFEDAIAQARETQANNGTGLAVPPISDAVVPKPESEAALREAIFDQIRLVYDPEIPVNLYDLGLIYGININNTAQKVHVTMTLTAPNCPVAGDIPKAVQYAISRIEGLEEVSVELVWEPKWDRSMMTEEAALELGFL